MNNKMNFPDGTLFVGKQAFVPKADGSGYKTVGIDERFGIEVLSDSLNGAENLAETDVQTGSDISDIKFDIDFTFADKAKSAKKEVKPDKKSEKDKSENSETKKTEKTEKPKVISVKFSDTGAHTNGFEDDADDETADDESGENIHSGHRARLYERYENLGLEGFAEHEVLEFLLYFVYKRRDTNPIAHRLINEFGSLEDVLKADISDLRDVKGVGDKSALLINFCRQLIIFLNSYKKEGIPLPNKDVMGGFCTDYFKLHPEENFIVLILDAKRRLKKVAPISKGTENETAFYPRKVLKSVIKYRANTVAIAHNHTGNCVHPSDNDIRVTDKISKLLDGIGVPLIDHIVCCNDRYTSLAERGMIGRDTRGMY